MDHTNDAPRPRKAPRLTGADRGIIAQARELAALDGDGIRARYPAEYGASHARAVGAAQFLLGELAAVADRLSTAEPAPPEDTRRLAEIRLILGRFHGKYRDPQLALEAIERITGGGRP